MNTKEKDIYPPIRVSELNSRINSYETYTFETAIEASDVVAHVRIGNWLGEDLSYTYYDAVIVEQFTGEKVDNIVIEQYGNSKRVYNRFPLFTKGNELLVFLRKKETTESDTVYEIIWDNGSTLYAVEDDEGNVYYWDRCGSLSVQSTNAITNIPMDLFTKKLVDKIVEADPYLAEDTYVNIYMYAKEEIKKLIEE